jgi:uncharacterized damage-inducible protein DinB
MPLSLSIDEVLAYTGGERDKWEQWFAGHPVAALDAAVQRDARFPTVWSLIDHVFLVEKRHTQRLKGESQIDGETRVAHPDVEALFAYGSAVRAELARFTRSTPEAELIRKREFHFRDSSLTITPRKLVFHILMHEIRHWAQIATAVRNARFAPPGDHDLLFSSALE